MVLHQFGNADYAEVLMYPYTTLPLAKQDANFWLRSYLPAGFKR